ncbi:unnamed protein product [Mucor hiemalis]
MDFTGKPKIKILLVGLSGVGKTSLCQAFGTNFVDGFSYGVGLSKKAKIVELKTEQNIFHVIDAPGAYDPRDTSNTQRHANEISKSLNLFSTPYVICFVICIQQHDMRVKYDDLMMMRTIKQFYSQGQVKFSVIINRLTESEFQVFADNSPFRKEFLHSFERDAGIPITDDDILLIHDKFLTHSMQDRMELLTSYLKKFEAGHMSDFAHVMKNAVELDVFSGDNFMASYNAYSNAYKDEISKIINQHAFSSQNNSMQILQQSIQEQQMKQTQLLQQMLGGNLNQTSYPSFQQSNPYMPGSNNSSSASQTYASPFSSNNNFLNQYLQQAATNSSNMTNNYVISYLNGGANQSTNPFQSYSNAANAYTTNSPSASNFQQGAFSPTESNNNSSTNNMFNAAGAFVGGAMGIPTTDFSQGNSTMYGAAGQFVGGAVTAGCSIM